jgi:hypothetical protein
MHNQILGAGIDLFWGKIGETIIASTIHVVILAEMHFFEKNPRLDLF